MPTKLQPGSRLSTQQGFTLIELSIVLVIIGVIVGGFVEGRQLLEAAKIRTQVSQIEKFQLSVKTFKLKYNCLPGDCKNAAQFGFAARGQYAGQGDDNGIIEGVSANAAASNGIFWQSAGETTLFWRDLSEANLIDGTFSLASATVPATITSSNVNSYLPAAALGKNSVYVWGSSGNDQWFGISSISSITASAVTSTPGISVLQAYAIDQKMDDGLPQSGLVIAMYNTAAYHYQWAGVWQTAVNPSASTCYDNANVALATTKYSMSFNGGAGVNCGLSFVWK